MPHGRSFNERRVTASSLTRFLSRLDSLKDSFMGGEIICDGIARADYRAVRVILEKSLEKRKDVMLVSPGRFIYNGVQIVA